jgi:hypothetical protein
MGRKKHPKCVKCKKTTQHIGLMKKGAKFVRLFGCRTPEVCGWKEYEYE